MKICVLALASLALLGCDLNEDEAAPDAAPPVEYGSLDVETTTEGEGGVFPVFGTNCANDANTGFFEGTFTGAGGLELNLKIKGFSTSPKTYNCSQADENASGEVGLLYNECAVTLTVPDPETATNIYAMHRAVPETDALDYMGACSISTQYEAPRVTATLDCAGLIQTHYEGGPRRPIVADVTATLRAGSSVHCDL